MWENEIPDKEFGISVERCIRATHSTKVYQGILTNPVPKGLSVFVT